MTTDPIKQDDLLLKIIENFVDALNRISVTYANVDEYDKHYTDIKDETVRAIHQHYIPKQALAAALEEIPDPKVRDNSDGSIVVLINPLKAELRARFGLEPKGDNSGKGSDQDG